MTQEMAEPSEECLLAILEEVAAAEDLARTALPPLHDAVDTTALQRFVTASHDSAVVRFDYCGYRVVVGGDGRVRVREPAEAPPGLDD